MEIWYCAMCKCVKNLYSCFGCTVGAATFQNSFENSAASPLSIITHSSIVHLKKKKSQSSLVEPFVFKLCPSVRQIPLALPPSQVLSLVRSRLARASKALTLGAKKCALDERKRATTTVPQHYSRNWATLTPHHAHYKYLQ